MKISIYPPDQQGKGAFDGGKITEQKPIGFPGEGSAAKQIGPLFYWAWAHSKEEGVIGSHPHQAFEIITYVVQGKAEHGDSLGTKSVVGPGGAQVMQTGSGVHHEEKFIGPDMEGFQIWFEPFIKDALKRPPTYNEYSHQDFPIKAEQGIRVKEVIGGESPITLVADVKMWDVELSAGNKYSYAIPPRRTLTTLAIRGQGTFKEDTDIGESEAITYRHKDFILIPTDSETLLTIQADESEDSRLIIIEVPTEVDYPRYFDR